MKTLFYYSNFLFEKDLKESAIRSLMKSRKLAIKFNDNYWRAKTAELMGEILCSNHNNNEAIKFNTEAAKYYSEAGREINARYSYLDLSINYGNTFDYERCFELIDSIKSIADVENDSSLLGYCFYIKYRFKFKNKEYENSRTNLDKYFAMSNYIKATAGDSAYKSWLCVLNNDYDSAKIILTKLIPEKYDNVTKAIIYFANKDLNERLGNFQNALRFSDSIMTCSDKDTRVVSSQILVDAQRDSFDKDLKYAEIKNKEQRSLLLFVVAIALLVVAFTVLFYQYRLKVRHLENERKVNDIMIVFNNLINRNMFNKIEEELQKIKEQLNNSRIVESIDKYLYGLASKFIEQCNFLMILSRGLHY
ncbi:MAG: hypothetical protein K2K88_09160 [Muribaculaceae bacterium]|nr:hypothetical protein [Muribaculaceae bacterium]